MRYLTSLIFLAGLAAVQPDVLTAQTSGVGCDGYTRFFWSGTDSRMFLWRLDPNLLNPISIQYGPYDGWTPVAMTVLCNNYTYVLWKYTDGTISLWKVDPNLLYVTSRVYGPYGGWIPESLIPDQTTTGNLRLLWKETQGMISMWVVDSNANFVFGRNYGPYFGFDPSPHANALHAHAVDGSSTPSDQAAEAMKVKAGSAVPMPE